MFIFFFLLCNSEERKTHIYCAVELVETSLDVTEGTHYHEARLEMEPGFKPGTSLGVLAF